jgi:hypothetical protein
MVDESNPRTGTLPTAAGFNVDLKENFEPTEGSFRKRMGSVVSVADQTTDRDDPVVLAAGSRASADPKIPLTVDSLAGLLLQGKTLVGPEDIAEARRAAQEFIDRTSGNDEGKGKGKQ